MTNPQPSVEAIFSAARTKGAAERAAYLDDACGDDPGVRKRVEALLAADVAAGDSLEADTESVFATKDIDRVLAAAGGSSTPEQIGPYKILDVLGEGGMGTVYIAEQKEPVRRRVALKVIKQGMDSKQVLHRFEAERQALAMMEHGTIAKVFEAGTTETGQPYFVMEYVKGIPITQHCDQHNASIEERLDLFRQVCSGVQHAHQKGVMHRDLKPSNVLVTFQEGEAIPKIIDFGLARATDHRLVAATIFTEQGLIVGTPEYMSPEQTGLGGQDVDTRTDVYSLGVLLYELLVGALPFSSAELRQAGQLEMERKIKEEEPPKPSTKLSSVGEESAHAAKHRRTDTRSLLRRLRADLDWVVMKAIEKDRARRYETPAALAEDLGRYLEHEPVIAGPPSAAYRLRKLARKYRTQAVAAGLILLTLFGGIIGTSIGFKRASDNEARANERADQLEQVTEFQATQLRDLDPYTMAIDLRNGMIAEARGAMERAGLAEAVISERIARIEELFTGANFTNLALDTLEANFFDPSIAAVDEQFADQPPLRAQLLHTIADSLHTLGRLEAATSPQALALAIRQAALGNEHEDTLDSLNSMGALLTARGELDKAEQHYREALRSRRRLLGDDHPDTMASIGNLGFLLAQREEMAEAELLYREALDRKRRVLGDDEPRTLIAINNLGALLLDLNRPDEAERYLLEALERRQRVLGEDHAHTLTSMHNMGGLRSQQERYEEAEDFYNKAVEGRRQVLGDEHPFTLISIGNLGWVLGSEQLCREAVTGARRVLGDDHLQTLGAMSMMGAALRSRGELNEAKEFFSLALDGRRRVLGNDHEDTLEAIHDLGDVLAYRREFDQAEEYLLEFLEGRQRVSGDDHPRTVHALNDLGVVLYDDGRFDAAEEYCRRALLSAGRVSEVDPSQTAEILDALGSILVAKESYAEAEPFLEKCIAIRQDEFSADHWMIFNAKSLLVASLAGQRRYAEAERFARDGYQDMKPPPVRAIRREQALERLVQFYEDWGKPDQAAKWRKLLEGDR